MTLILRSPSVKGARYGGHVPFVACAPYILSMLEHVALSTRAKPTPDACFQAISSDILGRI
jgi:hypothetical protein